MSANPLRYVGLPWVMRTVLLACVIVVWELVSRTGALGRTTLAAPSQIAHAVWTLGFAAELSANLARTLGEVVGSFGIAILAGIPFGVLLWRAPALSRVAVPFLSALYAVPLLFFYPLLLAYFGLGPRTIIAIAAATAAIPIMLHTRVALLHVHASYWKLGHLYGGTLSQRYRKIILPAATPYLMAGCKLGFAFSMIGAIGMEFVLSDRGIGHAVRFSYDLFQADQMYAYICLVVGLAMLCHGLFSWGERRLTRNQVTNVQADTTWQEVHFRSHRMRARLGIAALALLLALVYSFVAGVQIVPMPIETNRLFAPLLAAGSLYPHLIATLQPTLYGFGLALAAGCTIGAILGRSQYWRRVWEPVVAAFYSVPKITLFPLFVLVFGLGLESRVVMAFAHAVFPILVAMMTGVKELNPVYTKLARIERAGPLQLITKIYLPALGPALAAATRLGLNLALLGVVLSECFAAKRGLGYLIMDAYAADRPGRMFAMIGVLYVLAFVFMLLPANILARRKRSAAALRASLRDTSTLSANRYTAVP